MQENEKIHGSILDDAVPPTEGGSGISSMQVALEIKECLDLFSMDSIRPDGMTDEEVRLELAKGIAPIVRKLPEGERAKLIKQLLMDAAVTLRDAKKKGPQDVIVLTMGPDQSPKVTTAPGGIASTVKSALQTLFAAASRAAM